MIRGRLYSFSVSAIILTTAEAKEPITVRGVHGAMSLEELTAALDRIDGIVYALETDDSFPCSSAPTVSVFDETLIDSIPKYYPEKRQVEGFTGKGERLAGCFSRNLYGPGYKHSVAVFNMDATNSGKLYSAHYKCEFFEGCNTSVGQLAKDFQTSQEADIPLKEYPKSPDGTLFQAVTPDGEGVGIRQDGSILVITIGSKFLPEKDLQGSSKPKFQ